CGADRQGAEAVELVRPLSVLALAPPVNLPPLPTLVPGGGKVPAIPTSMLTDERHVIAVQSVSPRTAACAAVPHRQATPFGVWQGRTVVSRIFAKTDTLSGKVYCRYVWIPDPGF